MNEKEKEKIIRVVNQYFDVLYFCDLELFDVVFHPSAIYVTADENPVLALNMPEYRGVMAKRLPPAEAGDARNDYIDSIENAGENTATVRARCSLGTRDFIDCLTLIREGGQWMIISKVFHIIGKRARYALC